MRCNWKGSDTIDVVHIFVFILTSFSPNLPNFYFIFRGVNKGVNLYTTVLNPNKSGKYFVEDRNRCFEWFFIAGPSAVRVG